MSRRVPNYGRHADDEDVKIYRGKDKPVTRVPEKKTPRTRTAETSRRRPVKEYRALTGKDVGLLVLTAAALAVAWLLPVEGWIRAAVFAVPFLLAGFDAIMDALEQLLNKEFLKAEVLTSLAAITAFAIGAYPAAVLIMLLHRLCCMAEAFAARRSRKELDELLSIRPSGANVETAEGVLSVTPDYVNIGDIIVVEPGERIPLDGLIIEGISSVDGLPFSGERRVQAVAAGQRAVSGCVNISSPIRIKVDRSWEESTVNKLHGLIETAGEKRSRREGFAQRFTRIFTPAVFALALLLAAVPPLFNGQWLEYIRRAVVFLLVSCPGAMTISVSLSYINGVCRAAKDGALAKGSIYLETLAEANTMVFDKTGTITEGRFAVTDVFPEGLSEYELLSIAASAEAFSNHPIARSLREASSGLALEDDELHAEDIPGRGVKAFISGRQVLVGNAALLEENGIGYKVPSRSGAAIHVAVEQKYCGHILISDRIRRGAFDALENLRVQGVSKTVMLTGDVLSVARPIASKLNFDMLKAELRPEEKADAVEYLVSNKGGSGAVAFVGDALNDAAVLDRADVGLAMDALSSVTAMSAADILVMDDNIGRLPLAVRTARFTDLTARENIIAVLAVKMLLLAAAAAGFMPILPAAIADAAVFIACTLNSLRPLKAGKEQKNERSA